MVVLISDQHLLSFTGTKTPAYAELQTSASSHIELRLRRSSEFFGALIVPFVVEDLKTLLVRYQLPAALTPSSNISSMSIAG